MRNEKEVNINSVVRVETSNAFDTARGSPVGMLDIPYVPEWAYNLAYADPVGDPVLNI